MVVLGPKVKNDSADDVSTLIGIDRQGAATMHHLVHRALKF
jgi:hypothetical protein